MTRISQLDIEALRRKISSVQGGRMEPAPASPLPEAVPLIDESPPEHYSAEKSLDGEVLENPFGKYFLHERFYSGEARHGCYEIGHLAEMPGAWLEGISNKEIPAHDPRRWAFLDTETTGLAGGAATCAFLIGIGTIEDGGFRVRLFFMRDYDEEPAMLYAVAEFLQWYDVLVTYNGKSYDAPLIDTRYKLKRQKNPLERMHHLDLLHGARRLWKLRMENCRLMHLEEEVLGFFREGDLSGELIPYYYFEYLRTRQSFKLVPMFHHNVMDIVTLACLSGIVLPVFAAPDDASLPHGEDLLGIARWLRRLGEHERALGIYRRSIEAGLLDTELFAARWESAMIEKKLGNHDSKIEILDDLTQVENDFQVAAYEELAKHFEHRERNYSRAAALTSQALKLKCSDELKHREQRIKRKLGKVGA